MFLSLSQINKLFFLLRFYLFLERGEGREQEGKRNISVRLPFTRTLLETRPATQACALTGNPTSDPLVSRTVVNPLSYASQGLNKHIYFFYHFFIAVRI